jgi:hypothetical protein
MSDTFPKAAGDQAPVGYRPLPGSGTTPGPELKSLVYATVGIALGIMAGTVFADGSWRSFVPGMPHRSVVADSISAKATPSPELKAPTPATHPQIALRATAQVDADHLAAEPKPSPAEPVRLSRVEMPAEPIQQALPAATEETPVVPEKPVYRAYDPAFMAYARKVAKAQTPHSARPEGSELVVPYAAPVPRRRAEPLHRTESSHRAGRALRRASWRSSWRRSHGRHRLHGHVRFAAAHRITVPKAVEEAVIAPPERFAFTVEGSVTVTNYDADAGRIQTYEGETFVVDKSNTSNDVTSWVDYPADMHYTCNQAWDCTLVHGGAGVVSAHRTR